MEISEVIFLVRIFLWYERIIVISSEVFESLASQVVQFVQSTMWRRL